jgi:hypothetical protein
MMRVKEGAGVGRGVEGMEEERVNCLVVSFTFNNLKL